MIIAKVNNEFVVNVSEEEALELIEGLTRGLISARKNVASAVKMPVSERLHASKRWPNWAPAVLSIAVGL
jgi:hypothetical protein